MNTVTVKVTKKDISKGERFNCTSCPVARAMTRAIGKPVEARRLSWSFRRGRPSLYGRRLPESARQFIHNFDAGLFFAVRPFRFTITY